MSGYQQNEMKFKTGILQKQELKKQTNDYTIYKIIISSKDETIEFSVFSSINDSVKSLKLDELQIGQLYNFGFTENEKGKTIKWIGKIKDKIDKNNQQTSKTFNNSGEIVKVTFNKDSVNFKNFFEDYVESMIDENKEINFNHFIGAFIRVNKQELALTTLIEWLEHIYENKIKLEYGGKVQK